MIPININKSKKKMKTFYIFLILLPISLTQVTRQGQEMVNTCTNALMQTIPPMYCTKEGKINKVSPTKCPSGYIMNKNQCVKNCIYPETRIGNVCYKSCPAGFITYNKDKKQCQNKNKPAQRKQKEHYVAPTIDFNNPKVLCPNKYRKDGRNCIYKCSNIYMEDCGAGACALDKAACVKTIIDMIINVIQGLIEFVSFCVTLGASSGVKVAKTSLTTGLKKVNNQAIKAAFNSVKTAFKSKFKSAIKAGAKQAAKNLFNTFKGKSMNEVNKICDQVYQNIENRVSRRGLPTKEELIKAVDVFEISNIVSSCGKKDAYECTRACLNTAKNFDPTGLLTIATTFMKPRCKISAGRRLFENIYYEEDEINGCVKVYFNNEFNGDFDEICGDASFLKNPKSIDNNILSSYILFSEYNFEGNRILLGKGGEIKELDKYLEEGEKIKSVKKINDLCLYAFNKGKLYEICNDIENVDFDENTTFEIFSKYLIVDLYSEENYKGEHLRLKKNIPDLKTIKSIKVEFNYNHLGFLCGNEINSKEIIRKNENGEIECFSIDGINCVEKPYSMSKCIELIYQKNYEMKSLTCEKDIPRLFDVESEGMPEWCIKGQKYFNKSLEIIE